MFDNLKNKWTKEETQILSKYLSRPHDLEEVYGELPNRSKSAIYAKFRRLQASYVPPLPDKYVRRALEYYLEGVPEGQILARMQAAGIDDVTLPQLTQGIEKARKELITEYTKKHNFVKNPTLDQLRKFLNG